jgi:alkylhydroperoxidase/carboxymuconolactone decarboxylase family protein YurZ
MLAINAQSVRDAMVGAELAAEEGAGLDAKTGALVQLAATVAQGAASASYQAAVADALAAGATDGDVVGALLALRPVVGTVRLESAVPDVALALGCDLDLPGGQ